jgi:hypothetical protein
MSAVREILTNPRYLGFQVSGRTKKKDVLLDPDVPALGHGPVSSGSNATSG